MKKKQLLATLVMLSLMQGSAYAAEINSTVTSSQKWSEDVTFKNVSSVVKIPAGETITLNADGHKMTFDSSSISLGNSQTLNIVADEIIFTGNGNYNGGVFINSGTNKPSYINFSDKVTFDNWTGVTVSAEAQGDTTFIFNKGLEIKNTNFSSQSMLFKLQQASAYTTDLTLSNISSENRSNGSGHAIEVWGDGYLNVSQNEGEGTGTLTINDFAGTHGLYIYGGAVEVQNLVIDNMYLKNDSDTAVQGIYALGNLYIADSGEIKNIAGNGVTEGLQGTLISDINDLTITNITSKEDIARGMRLYEQRGNSSYADFGTLTIKEITGATKAEGLVITAGTGQDGVSPITIGQLNINNIKATNENGIENGLSVATSALSITGSANITTDVISNTYDGAFTADPTVHNVNSAAIRVMEGGEVYMNGVNGNNEGTYNIDGTIVVGNGSATDDPNVAAGKLTIGGSQTVIRGDVYSGNGGEINITLNGTNSILEGQVDDYHELANEDMENKVFHNSAFTDDEGNELDVTSAGKATLNINDGGKWIARGQSFVDTISLDGGIIDMSKNENSSVTVENLKGEGGQFIMRLDTGDHTNSDMLYVTGTFEGNHELIIDSDEFVASEITKDNPLRFATIKGDVNVENMKARVTDAGFFNNTYNITKENFEKNHAENEAYNGSGNGQGSYKPGNDVVTSTFDEDDVNLLITAEGKQSQISDAGQTIINMSRANYSNAIYMDRLNKRMGEARYISPEDEQGMWVRLRHDRIGKEDAFRSQNTMYEMGYDVKQDCDNGDRHVGFAIDYMDGKTEYRNVAGDGDIKRYGLWLYDTWMGDKGHYADYVLKWGHLENDFDIYNSRGKVNGDYSNNVFSVSAEYGKKNDMGNDWYFEPQAQLQLARVTGADYVTSQNTKVSLDGINSLIGRAGFRLGKDMGERSTVYVKADVLHEFLGDQTISALDTTTNGTYRETFENKGTWYDVGFGFATALGKDSYAFMDFEKSFGNDNDETYQINAGVQWTF